MHVSVVAWPRCTGLAEAMMETISGRSEGRFKEGRIKAKEGFDFYPRNCFQEKCRYRQIVAKNIKSLSQSSGNEYWSVKLSEQKTYAVCSAVYHEFYKSMDYYYRTAEKTLKVFCRFLGPLNFRVDCRSIYARI